MAQLLIATESRKKFPQPMPSTAQLSRSIIDRRELPICEVGMDTAGASIMYLKDQQSDLICQCSLPAEVNRATLIYPS